MGVGYNARKRVIQLDTDCTDGRPTTASARSTHLVGLFCNASPRVQQGQEAGGPCRAWHRRGRACSTYICTGRTNSFPHQTTFAPVRLACAPDLRMASGEGEAVWRIRILRRHPTLYVGSPNDSCVVHPRGTSGARAGRHPNLSHTSGGAVVVFGRGARQRHAPPAAPSPPFFPRRRAPPPTTARTVHSTRLCAGARAVSTDG